MEKKVKIEEIPITKSDIQLLVTCIIDNPEIEDKEVLLYKLEELKKRLGK